MEKKMTLSQKGAVAALSILVGLGVVGGYKYYTNREYKVGECLMDRESKFPFKIVEVTKDTYTLEIDFGIMVATLPVKKSELNSSLVQRIDCETGAPLEL